MVAQLAPSTARYRFGIARVSFVLSLSSQYNSTREAHFDFDRPAETSQLLSTSRVRAAPAQAAQLFSTRVVHESARPSAVFRNHSAVTPNMLSYSVLTKKHRGVLVDPDIVDLCGIEQNLERMGFLALQ